jgi:hypothetical protein
MAWLARKWRSRDLVVSSVLGGRVIPMSQPCRLTVVHIQSLNHTLRLFRPRVDIACRPPQPALPTPSLLAELQPEDHWRPGANHRWADYIPAGRSSEPASKRRSRPFLPSPVFLYSCHTVRGVSSSGKHVETGSSHNGGNAQRRSSFPVLLQVVGYQTQ